MRIGFELAKNSLMKAIDKCFDVSPDFIDKILIEEIRDLSEQLNEVADEQEKILLAK